MPLDFVQLKERHTGEYLARMVQFIVEKFGLTNRICGIVSDNASNNCTMIDKLERLNWKRFKGTTSASEFEESDGEDDAGDPIESFEKYKSDLDEEDQSDSQSAANNGELDEEDELTLANLEDIKKEEEEDT
ncbi:hypothetical protein PCASD_24780 [Puccinia coronata f. sp. avenae]|uniref:DUF659 domain-containing protein n=1 Tax=Puccinia coronata f. sp. avenae TaxID=200324 RepID=A0A2N5S2J9_9BASI|nr:hypothetical protein PCASD_24780 [Puccinia coronata f. sp. avenae]